MNERVRRHTIVIPGGNMGASIAVAASVVAGLSDARYFTRRDGRMQVSAVGPTGARSRWVEACGTAGLKVDPAPWERDAKRSAVDKVVAAADAPWAPATNEHDEALS